MPHLPTVGPNMTGMGVQTYVPPPSPPFAGIIGQPMNRQTASRIQSEITSVVRSMETTGAISNTYTWTAWNVNYNITGSVSLTNTTASTTDLMAINNYIWSAWNAQGTTSGTCPITIDNTWGNWVDRNDQLAALRTAGAISHYSRRQMSEEELLRELQREKKMREAADKRAAEALMAQKRAENLLHSCLSPQQAEDLQKKNCFYVEIEGRTGRKERYRIDRGHQGNVKQVDEKGSIIRSFCVHPVGVPVADTMLAQKLFLESSDESRAEFWETANIAPVMAEKAIPHTVPRKERRRYAEQHGLLH